MAAPVEILAPVALCTPEGRLNPAARGWARQPLLQTGLRGPFLRRKRWNFAFISHPEVLVAVAMSHADYAGLAFVWMYDLRRRRFLELEQLSPLGLGVHIGDTVDEPAEFGSRPLHCHWQREAGQDLLVTVRAPRMKGSEFPFELTLRVKRRPEEESFHIVAPWSDTRFNYTGKLVALPAEAELTAGGERYALGAAETLASIDCTRGLWPYKTAWHWSFAAGHVKGRRVGANFAAGWTDGTGVTENALFVDGKVMPLWEPVDFLFDKTALHKPWTVRTPGSPRVALTFTPVYNRTQDTNLLVLRMKLEQVMGHFAGRVLLDNGEALELDGLPGIAENHLARW